MKDGRVLSIQESERRVLGCGHCEDVTCSGDGALLMHGKGCAMVMKDSAPNVELK